MSLLAIDYGEKKIGLAISEDGLFALPLINLSNKGVDKFFAYLKTLIVKHQIEKIILGLPLGLAGQTTEQTSLIEKFYSRLIKEISLPVIKVDERFSSQVISSSQRGAKLKQPDDAAAAAVILQDYLERSRLKQ